MAIRNTRELKINYQMIDVYNSLKPETPDQEKILREQVCKLKREIREYNHKPVDEARVIRDNGFDNCIVLVPLPERIKTKEGAHDYFMDTEYRECRPSMYDCTGQIFTNWFKIIFRHGRFWAYHSMGMDV